MELNLLPILNFDGKKTEISEDISLAERKNDNFCIIAPVHFDGVAANVGGTIELTGNALAKVSLVCDRCAETYNTDVKFKIDERFRKEDSFSNKDDAADFITFSGTIIDLDEVIYTNLYMNLPSKNLCSDDCKGLCPICGKNLNLGDCGCTTENTDPRFDILDKLL